MSEILEQLINFPMIVFCLAVFALVWIQRKGLELAFPNLKKSKVWREFFVPLGPIGTGGVCGAFIDQYPYPDMFESKFSHIIFGIVCGLLCGFFYRIINKNVMDRLKKQQ